MFLTNLLWIGYQNITKLNQPNALPFEPDKHSMEDQPKAENLNTQTQQAYDYIEEYESKVKSKEFGKKYGPSKKKQHHGEHSDIDIISLLETDQKYSKNVRNDMENPPINTRTIVETKQSVDQVDSIQEFNLNAKQRNNNDAIKTLDATNTRSNKLKRFAQTHNKLQNLTNKGKRLPIGNSTESYIIETNPLQNKPETPEKIFNNFYLSSITYAWHFFENPRILRNATFCNSYTNVDACDLTLEKVIEDHDIYKHVYFALDSYLQTRFGECLITAVSDDNGIRYQTLCRLMLPDNIAIPTSFDFQKFLDKKRSLQKVKVNDRIFSSGLTENEDFVIKKANDDDKYVRPQLKEPLNTEFKVIYKSLHQNLADKNSKYHSFAAKNPTPFFIFAQGYQKDLPLFFYSLNDTAAVVHVLNRKLYLQRNNEQNISDALHEIEATINATDAIKNGKTLVILSNLICILLVRII
ncbi:hypothetical protein BDAP_001501 [Binucleata daphniae]